MVETFAGDESLNNELKKLSKSYLISKEAFALAEDTSHNVPYGTLNEYRNALFHLIEAFQEEDKNKVKHELHESNGHIIRATYDCFELTVIFLIKKIVDFEHDYPKYLVAKFIPNYYDEILPYIDSIREKLRSERTSRKKFDEYQPAIDKLQGYIKMINLNKANLTKESSKFLYVVIALFFSGLGALITWLLFYFK